jgi:hypothetical protein
MTSCVKINGVHSNLFLKNIDYRNNTWNHTYFWDSCFEKRKRGSIYIVSTIKKYYELIEAFQGVKFVNTPLHTKDMHVEGDKVYKPRCRKHKMRMKT